MAFMQTQPKAVGLSVRQAHSLAPNLLRLFGHASNAPWPSVAQMPPLSSPSQAAALASGGVRICRVAHRVLPMYAETTSMRPCPNSSAMIWRAF